MDPSLVSRFAGVVEIYIFCIVKRCSVLRNYFVSQKIVVYCEKLFCITEDCCVP